MDSFAELYENGYRRGSPHSGLINGAAIDAQVCHESVCEKCATHGLEYHPFINEQTGSYRAFSQCPNCKDIQEF